MIKTYDIDNESEIIALLKKRNVGVDKEIVKSVESILERVEKEGDSALIAYSKEFDKAQLTDFCVTQAEIDKAFANGDKELIEALEEAAKNIELYHKKQVKEGYVIKKENGVVIGQRVMPLNRVGVYVPGGTASYPSTVLMNVIPAKVGGVREIVMITPPNKEGKVSDNILIAAKIAGVGKILKIGGAHGVAALAYGTQTIEAVDKIVGPGNIFVATAKRLLYGTVDIDMIAGPSEILIVADDSANPKYVAADMLSQCEHDPLASALLITNSEALAKNVQLELEKQTETQQRSEIIKKSLSNFGGIIMCKTIDKGIEFSNKVAPEHLEIMVDNPFNYLEQVTNAGSIFLGHSTPEPLGDYFAGTNHVLPTNGTARFFSPLSVDSFIKKSSYLYYTNEELTLKANKIIAIANSEGLYAHANSIATRLDG